MRLGSLHADFYGNGLLAVSRKLGGVNYVRFGSLADLFRYSGPMSAFGGTADVLERQKQLEPGSANGQKLALQILTTNRFTPEKIALLQDHSRRCPSRDQARKTKRTL